MQIYNNAKTLTISDINLDSNIVFIKSDEADLFPTTAFKATVEEYNSNWQVIKRAILDINRREWNMLYIDNLSSEYCVQSDVWTKTRTKNILTFNEGATISQYLTEKQWEAIQTEIDKKLNTTDFWTKWNTSMTSYVGTNSNFNKANALLKLDSNNAIPTSYLDWISVTNVEINKTVVDWTPNDSLVYPDTVWIPIYRHRGISTSTQSLTANQKYNFFTCTDREWQLYYIDLYYSSWTTTWITMSLYGSNSSNATAITTSSSFTQIWNFLRFYFSNATSRALSNYKYRSVSKAITVNLKMSETYTETNPYWTAEGSYNYICWVWLIMWTAWKYWPLSPFVLSEAMGAENFAFDSDKFAFYTWWKILQNKILPLSTATATWKIVASSTWVLSNSTAVSPAWIVWTWIMSWLFKFLNIPFYKIFTVDVTSTETEYTFLHNLWKNPTDIKVYNDSSLQKRVAGTDSGWITTVTITEYKWPFLIPIDLFIWNTQQNEYYNNTKIKIVSYNNNYIKLLLSWNGRICLYIK